MDPFTLMALMKGVESVGQGVSGYMAADASFGESEADRLKELKRREELGTLGFTGEEQNRIMRDMLNPIQAREAQRSLETRQILGAGDLGASQSAIANMIQADKGEAARAGATESYLQQQMDEKRQQESELRELQKAQDAEKAAKQAAIVSALTGGIAGQAETQQRKALFDEIKYGQPAANAARAAQGLPPLTEAELTEMRELSGYTGSSI